MAWDFDRDLEAVFTGPGTVEVEIDGQPCTRGFLSEVQVEEADGSGGMVPREGTVLHLPREAAKDLAFGQEIRVDGRQRKVRRVLPEDDGKVAAVQLVTVPE